MYINVPLWAGAHMTLLDGRGKVLPEIENTVYRGPTYMMQQIVRHSHDLAKALTEDPECFSTEDRLNLFNMMREVPNDIDTIWTELNKALSQ